MSNISLTDGEPITYDLIKLLIDKVNEIDSAITGSNLKTAQRINVVGSGLGKADSLTILCDDAIVRLEEKQTYTERIDFGDSSFADIPHVVATVADLKAKKNDVLNAPYATVSIGDVDKNGFNYRVDVLKVSAKNTKIKVNYIAIGRAKANQ